MNGNVLDNIRCIKSYSLWVECTHKQAINNHIAYMLRGGDVWIAYKNNQYYLAAVRTISKSKSEKLPINCNAYLLEMMDIHKVHISNKPWRMVYQ